MIRSPSLLLSILVVACVSGCKPKPPETELAIYTVDSLLQPAGGTARISISGYKNFVHKENGTCDSDAEETRFTKTAPAWGRILADSNQLLQPGSYYPFTLTQTNSGGLLVENMRFIVQNNTSSPIEGPFEFLLGHRASVSDLQWSQPNGEIGGVWEVSPADHNLWRFELKLHAEAMVLKIRQVCASPTP